MAGKVASKGSPTHAALFRGINVGKAKRVAMEELRKLFEELGCTGVATLINSGNVVYAAPRGKALTAKRIEEAFEARFGFGSRVTLLEAAELAAMVAVNPLEKVTDNPSRLIVAVLKTTEDREKLAHLLDRKWHPDALALSNRAAYVWCPAGSLESPALEEVGKILRDSITTRNWATMCKLHALFQT